MSRPRPSALEARRPNRGTYDLAIHSLVLTPAEYDDLIRSPFVDEHLTGAQVASVVVTGRPVRLAAPGSLPVVVVAVGDVTGGIGPSGADLVLDEDDVDEVVAVIDANPEAATSLAVLLRSTPAADVEAALSWESAVYSTLQGGREFARWRAAAPHEPAPDRGDAVLVERDGDDLFIRLNRPERHNAISTRLRDGLVEALQLAITDTSLTSVHLLGNGRSFCSGGDLGEFGLRPDPTTAHLTRLVRSPARLMHRLRERTTVHLHGAAMGGGIELAAFAGRVVAHPDTVIDLPEVLMGLIPGAGGTVSIPRRVGRQRTALLALRSTPIDVRTALEWSLVDDVEPRQR